MIRIGLGVFLLLSAAVASSDDQVTAQSILADLASPDYQVRRRAVLACEGRREPEILERLLAVARTDAHPNIRGQAAETLATFEDPRVFGVLASMARRESSGALHGAYVALGKHGDPRARPILLAALEANGHARAYAARGLGFLGDKSAFSPILAVYLAHLGDPYLHDLGAEALFRLDPPKAVAALLPRFAAMPAPARLRLARALGAHATPAVTKALIAHLGAEDKGLRGAAVQGLGLARSREATMPLLAHLRAHPAEARSAIDALGSIGDARALGALADVLAKVSDPLTRVHAIRALARIGDRKAVSALIACLDDRRTTRQPIRYSAIHGFPYNSRVDAAAVWAIRTLVDGKEPFDVAHITHFPEPVLPADVAAEMPRIRAWWKALEDRSAYALGP